MTTYTRRQFLEIGSLSAAAVLLGRAVPTPRAPSAAFVQALWSGALTPTSVRINARIDHDSATVRALVSPNADLSGPIPSPFASAGSGNNRMVGLPVVGLSPDTNYYYGIESMGTVDDVSQGAFRTPVGGPFSFSFAFASCANTGSSHAVFDTIRALNPLFFLHMGDMHYQDIGVNDQSLFRAAFDTVLASPSQSALYRAVPIAYIWDDHDYGPNNSNSTAPGRPSARATYQEYVPHYPLPAGSGDVPIYQSFVIGRVRFILTDLRSERSPQSDLDGPSKTMLGAAQKAWFKNELLAGRDGQKLTVWVGTVPWIDDPVAGGDHWAGYAAERRELADFIKDSSVTNLLMLSGDAHMIALDDGSNSDYATGGGAPFPVMHAAALDRSGSTKGGPYSHGTFPGGGQFGYMSVTDNGGDTVTVTLSGRESNDIELVGYSFDVTSKRVYLPAIANG